MVSVGKMRLNAKKHNCCAKDSNCSPKFFEGISAMIMALDTTRVKTILGVFEKMGKTTIRFVTSVCASIHMEQLGSLYKWSW
jgi:hypothetical protein